MTEMRESDLTAQRITLADVTLNVIDVGEGPAVMLLHGFPDRALMWRHQIRALRDRGFRVIAPDLRGFGDSDRPIEVDAYTIDKQATDICNLADQLGVDDFSVGAHDWGAAVGWLLASAMPERVRQLAAFSVGHPSALAAAGFEQKALSWYMLWWQFPGVAEAQLPVDDWRWFREWIHDGASRLDDPDLDRQLTDLERPGALAAGVNWYRANVPPQDFARSTIDPPLAPVRCPVVGVWSSRDVALTEQQMTGSERYVEGPWRYERFAEVGHWIPVSASDKTTKLLLEFFS